MSYSTQGSVVISWLKCRSRIFLRRQGLVLLLALLLAGYTCTLLARWTPVVSTALYPPQPLLHDLSYLKRSRKLRSYIDNMSEPLIEPSGHPCGDMEELPLLALVSSAPYRIERRDAIRATWGQNIPTYFFLGLPTRNIDQQLVDNYLEGQQHEDIIVADFIDTYHNLTLKTALMMKWSLRRCPHAQYVLKTDDDVLVNPWTLKIVLQDHVNAKLIGYRKQNSTPHRDMYTKWFLPRWLYPADQIPEFLSGTAYLVSGKLLPKIYEEAFKVPLINLEDVFFTYLVARQSLGLLLSHDYRLSPGRPLLALDCAYWTMATAHSLTSEDMLRIWPKLKALAEENSENKEVCQFYINYLSSIMIFY